MIARALIALALSLVAAAPVSPAAARISDGSASVFFQTQRPSAAGSAGWRIVNTEGSGARLREGPSTQATTLLTLPEGSTVDRVGGPLENDGVTWLQVRTSGGQLGWVSSALLQAPDGPAPAVPTPTPARTPAPTAPAPPSGSFMEGLWIIGETDGLGANFREGPSREAKVIELMADGTFVEPLNETTTADELTWRKIRVNQREGWVVAPTVRAFQPQT